MLLKSEISHQFTLRPATFEDRDVLSGMINNQRYLLRHLDWRSPFDWLGTDHFFILEGNKKPLAALACIAEPVSVAWIRFFCVVDGMDVQLAWDLLFKQAKMAFSNSSTACIAALGMQDWMFSALERWGFIYKQAIVVLEWSGEFPQQPNIKSVCDVRHAHTNDLSNIVDIDFQAFDPLWQNPFEAIKKAQSQAAYFTVAVKDNEVIGYQLSTANLGTAHLARLAVLPSMQAKGVGKSLVMDMLRYFNKNGIHNITVNTQNDNVASLTLYNKIGFRMLDEQVPVFVYTLTDE